MGLLGSLSLLFGFAFNFWAGRTFATKHKRISDRINGVSNFIDASKDVFTQFYTSLGEKLGSPSPEPEYPNADADNYRQAI